MSPRPSAVLFTCTLNAVRSPMAEAMAKKYFGREMRIESAGVRAGETDGFAMVAMQEIGLDITRHWPRTFEELEFTEFDLVIALSSSAQRKAEDFFHGRARVEFWPTEDATMIEGARDQKLEAFREVRDGLLARIKQRFR
ncbi:low molecular weight phosphatase family protein [Rhodoblastus acidophilus]|uniref:Low molecular weight phosphatase family protein n=1 Tax=Rhodoblastus acidophilus TaxID=1074 RepID=A0A6N8DSD0_RHOAC|nr:low molecular weight phosphatase family protein [Rhodoblastus acidophilus]MCW2275606.1 protein-tyrosine-phosphatase [Rhodoblastus acidophilus]MTV32103.1 low molecular weight phosphatase family protein [Rhodoblastus acidophilus]